MSQPQAQPKILDKRAARPDPTDLPLPGDERREALKARQDRLDEAAEETAQALEVESMDPSAFAVEHEIAQHFTPPFFDGLDVTNAREDRAYCWTNKGQNGLFIKSKLARGWFVIQGEDRESWEMRQADGTRSVGDTLLMAISRERKAQLDAYEEHRRRLQSGSIEAGLAETAERGMRRGAIARIHVGDDVSPEMLRTMNQRAIAHDRGRRTVDQMIRQGRMPGVLAPGQRRG